MILAYSTLARSGKIDMKEYVEDKIKELPEELNAQNQTTVEPGPMRSGS